MNAKRLRAGFWPTKVEPKSSAHPNKSAVRLCDSGKLKQEAQLSVRMPIVLSLRNYMEVILVELSLLKVKNVTK